VYHVHILDGKFMNMQKCIKKCHGIVLRWLMLGQF